MSNILRRNLWTIFLGLLPAFGQKKPKLASGAEILRSFDARDWARHFVAHVKAIPGLAEDEETMTGWFANAIMRGYDEARRDADMHILAAGRDWSENLTREAIEQRVAQGWCAPANSHKAMDTDLASAIVDRLVDLKA